MELSDEDREILEVEKRRRELREHLFREWSGHPVDSPDWREYQDLCARFRAIVYGADGNFRDDLRHLLDGKALDVGLLDDGEDEPQQTELEI